MCCNRWPPQLRSVVLTGCKALRSVVVDGSATTPSLSLPPGCVLVRQEA
jgi:hypothetical protein